MGSSLQSDESFCEHCWILELQSRMWRKHAEIHRLPTGRSCWAQCCAAACMLCWLLLQAPWSSSYISVPLHLMGLMRLSVLWSSLLFFYGSTPAGVFGGEAVRPACCAPANSILVPWPALLAFLSLQEHLRNAVDALWSALEPPCLWRSGDVIYTPVLQAFWTGMCAASWPCTCLLIFTCLNAVCFIAAVPLPLLLHSGWLSSLVQLSSVLRQSVAFCNFSPISSVLRPPFPLSPSNMKRLPQHCSSQVNSACCFAVLSASSHFTTLPALLLPSLTACFFSFLHGSFLSPKHPSPCWPAWSSLQKLSLHFVRRTAGFFWCQDWNIRSGVSSTCSHLTCPALSLLPLNTWKFYVLEVCHYRHLVVVSVCLFVFS